jgi:hypothetical protein
MLEYLLILDITILMESTGRISLKPGRKTTTESSRQISRDIPWNTALNIQPVETSKLKYQDFEILGEKFGNRNT